MKIQMQLHGFKTNQWPVCLVLPKVEGQRAVNEIVATALELRQLLHSTSEIFSVQKATYSPAISLCLIYQNANTLATK